MLLHKRDSLIVKVKNLEKQKKIFKKDETIKVTLCVVSYHRIQNEENQRMRILGIYIHIVQMIR